MHRRADIDRYLTEGLSAAVEKELRQHLRSCQECRRFYDEEVRLRRALAGTKAQPTRTEDARIHRLVLERAGLPHFAPAPRLAVFDRVREKPWRLALPLGAVAAAAVIALFFIHPWHEPQEPYARHDAPTNPAPSAHFTQTKDATINGALAKVGTPIPSGAEVAVPSEGIAEIELLRGGRIRLFPNTHLMLTPRGETIALGSGKIWCEVEPGRGRFIVRTERGEARVLGTSFVVEKQTGGDTDVRVLSGVVEVEDSGHRGIVRLKESQRSRLQSGAAPTHAARYESEADRDDWEQSFRKLGRDVERTFKKLGDKLHLP